MVNANFIDEKRFFWCYMSNEEKYAAAVETLIL